MSVAFTHRGIVHAPRSTLNALYLCAVGGDVVGAGLLSTLPSNVFIYVATVFIAITVVLVLLQPRPRSPDNATPATGYGGVPVAACVAATSAYGGYFGVGQGVICSRSRPLPFRTHCNTSTPSRTFSRASTLSPRRQ